MCRCCIRWDPSRITLPDYSIILYLVLVGNLLKTRSFFKTLVFEKATLDLKEKPVVLPVFPKPFSKLTEFWNKLNQQGFLEIPYYDKKQYYAIISQGTV